MTDFKVGDIVTNLHEIRYPAPGPISVAANWTDSARVVGAKTADAIDRADIKVPLGGFFKILDINSKGNRYKVLDLQNDKIIVSIDKFVLAPANPTAVALYGVKGEDQKSRP